MDYRSRVRYGTKPRAFIVEMNPIISSSFWNIYARRACSYIVLLCGCFATLAAAQEKTSTAISASIDVRPEDLVASLVRIVLEFPGSSGTKPGFSFA
jgi:hypothetical protein